MNIKAIALRCGSAAGNLPAIREIDDPDLMVNMINRHPGHVQRRKDKADARKRAIRRAEDERQQQLRDWATVSMFSMLGAVLAVGLAL